MWTKDFDDWETEIPVSGVSEAEATAMRQCVAVAAQVREWAQLTPPVTVHQDWWRAVARPVEPAHDAGFEPHPVPVQPRWEVFAGYHAGRDGTPYPEATWVGEYIGHVDGQNPPAEATLAAIVADWVENCE